MPDNLNPYDISEKRPFEGAFAEKHTNQRFASMEDLMPLFREQLATGRSVRFSPRGVSMLPMLRQGVDSVVISPLPERLSRYDIPLYQRENGAYVLHRVVEVTDTPESATAFGVSEPIYSCMGDNQFVPELGLRRSQMIAVVTAFYRGETYHSVNEPGYKLYYRFWYRTRRVRYLAIYCARFTKRCLRFVRRKCAGK